MSGFTMLLYLLGASLALTATFALVALVDNRMNFGSWWKRSGKADSQPIAPITGDDRDAFLGGGGGAP